MNSNGIPDKREDCKKWLDNYSRCQDHCYFIGSGLKPCYDPSMVESLPIAPTVKNKEEYELLNHWSTELWQIIRYHASEIEVNFNLNPAWGVTWTISLIYLEKPLYTDSGVNLWKRFKKATEFLKGFYGKNAHVYMGMPCITDKNITKSN